jgi:nucleoside-diphosphate-sugar epimerase
MKILITGGAGLIGSHIADKLLVKKGLPAELEVVVLDNFSRGTKANLKNALKTDQLTVVDGDIRDRDLLKEIMQGVDLVFHQAAIRITQCAEDPRLAFEVLATGTLNVLEAAHLEGVKKVVAASSASVYGMADTFPIDELHHPYNNRTIYGAAKTFNEGLLRSFYEMYGLDYVALRYFNVYGPRMDVWGVYTEVLVRWMELIDAGDSPVIHGDGSATMDFIFAPDIADANIAAAFSSVTDEVFNIAYGEEVSLSELAETLISVMGSNLKPKHGPLRGVNAVPRRLADVDKAKRMLGFEAATDLHQGLVELVDWWQCSKKQ